ncbi:extracellular solute-binding protein [Parenemella sanctibonifatiensis]|uniref:Extracellular solute-binding protein n=1 Tax=Parenemella sanctibonifatiensis TaxID=2016505 RepID=A0A255EB42_9ACTN|nr:extracellular solute-binding protein [Parenemella sanctibonifatiensis]OYN88746.1 hypothetical protein CGZ92_03290 [Parenemella sanctibonifatiensis]
MRLNRRSLLAGTAAVAAGAALSACSTDDATGGGGEAGGNSNAPESRESLKPTYTKLEGTTPDVEADVELGLPEAYWTFPDPAPSRDILPLPEIATISFLTQGNAPPAARGNNQRWDDLEKATGAQWDITFGSFVDYDAVFQTRVASGDLPDFVQVVPVSRFGDLLESQFEDLTEYLAGDAAAEYPALAAMRPDAWDVGIINGALRAIPRPRTAATGRCCRTSAANLEAIGLDPMVEPANYEELYDIFTELTGNGKFAMGSDPVEWLLNLVLEGVGAPNVWRVEDDGSFTHANETEEMVAALEWVKKVWDAGLLHPNSFIEPQNNNVWWKAEQTTFYHEGAITRVNLTEEGADRGTGFLVNPKFDGGGPAAKHTGPGAYYAPIAISKQDSPDRVRELLRVADALASPYGTAEFLRLQYGIEGRHYTLEDGAIKTDSDMSKQEPLMTNYLGMQGSAVFTGPQKSGEMTLDFARKIMADKMPNPAENIFNEEDLNSIAAERQLTDLKADIIQGRQPMSAWEGGVKRFSSAKEKAKQVYAEEYAKLNG